MDITVLSLSFLTVGLCGLYVYYSVLNVAAFVANKDAAFRLKLYKENMLTLTPTIPDNGRQQQQLSFLLHFARRSPRRQAPPSMCLVKC